jgi:hypothetical protein
MRLFYFSGTNCYIYRYDLHMRNFELIVNSSLLLKISNMFSFSSQGDPKVLVTCNLASRKGKLPAHKGVSSR